jgi:glycosyltransferase involved in cell wall biosynthesis
MLADGPQYGGRMTTFGVFHYQVGQTDGVSLEIDKWKRVLEDLGHTVHLCAGDLGAAQGTLIEEMFHHRADAQRLYHDTFVALEHYPSEAAYRNELLSLAAVIERKMRAFVNRHGVDFLIPQNVWSVAANPAVSIALARLMGDLRLPALAHHHDFYWERTTGVALTTATAVELADKYLPPRSPLCRHVVINRLAQRELAERKGIEASVVPNVFDFDGPGWQLDDYKRELRAQIGLRPNDILILQATRVVRRKGIELAVDFVRALDQPQRRARLKQSGLFDGRPFDDGNRVVLMLAGYTRDDLGGGYVRDLQRKIEQAGIDALFIEDWVGAQRQDKDGRKRFSLWDTYVCADFATYPSQWEGWGNQFLEALRARLPLVVFEYPVYVSDLKGKGFRVVSLGSEIERRDQHGLVQVSADRVEAAADQAVELLTNATLRRQTVEHNFQLARRHYSLEALRSYLGSLISGQRHTMAAELGR